MCLWFSRFFVGGIFLSLLSLTGYAAPFSKLVAFSGSLSDTGNMVAFTGELPPPYVDNRNTNGPAAIDILAERFGLSSESSLHLLGLNEGTNYSVLHASAAGDSPIDLPAQLDAYFSANGSVSDPDALYFIFIGANDIVAAGLEEDEYLSKQILVSAIDEIDRAFRKLHSSGARFFSAPNNVDIGITPIAIQFGVSDLMTAKTIKFNRMFERKLRQLERELGITIYRFDFFRFVDDLLKVSDQLKITNTTDSCIAKLDLGLCELDNFAFINELLPTAKIHQLFGNALVTSMLDQMSKQKELNGFCHKSHKKCKAKGYSLVRFPKKKK